MYYLLVLLDIWSKKQIIFIMYRKYFIIFVCLLLFSSGAFCGRRRARGAAAGVAKTGKVLGDAVAGLLKDLR